MTPPVHRREFLATTAALAAAATLPASAVASAPFPRAALPKSATDRVILGKTGIAVSGNRAIRLTSSSFRRACLSATNLHLMKFKMVLTNRPVCLITEGS